MESSFGIFGELYIGCLNKQCRELYIKHFQKANNKCLGYPIAQSIKFLLILIRYILYSNTLKTLAGIIKKQIYPIIYTVLKLYIIMDRTTSYFDASTLYKKTRGGGGDRRNSRMVKKKKKLPNEILIYCRCESMGPFIIIYPKL